MKDEIRITSTAESAVAVTVVYPKQTVRFWLDEKAENELRWALGDREQKRSKARAERWIEEKLTKIKAYLKKQEGETDVGSDSDVD